MFVGAREIEKKIEGNLCELSFTICPKAVVSDELGKNYNCNYSQRINEQLGGSLAWVIRVVRYSSVWELSANNCVCTNCY